MKYCPKCGSKIDTNDKFCDQCSTNLSDQNKSRIKPIIGSEKQKENSRIRRNCLIIATCTIVLAAGGVVFFTLQSQNSNYANSIPFVGHKKGEAVDQAAESIGYNSDKMTAHDTAGFTIAFAHMNFQDNPDWEKAFDNVQNGDLNITSYPEYDFGDYNVKAPAQGTVYVVTPEVGYVVSDINHPQRAQITFVDSKKGATQPVYFRALAKKVAHSSCKKDVQNIGKKVKVSVQKKNNRQSSDKNTKSGTEDTSKLSWNDSKEEKLSDFMSDFGDKMDQDYDEYIGDEQLKTRAGEEYPDIFKDGKMKLVDDSDKDADESESIDIGWDPELKKKYDYQVVSIFNYNDDDAAQHITYLFCVHDNQPIVLVDQTTNGNYIAVKETANKDVKSVFADIINGDDTDDD